MRNDWTSRRIAAVAASCVALAIAFFYLSFVRGKSAQASPVPAAQSANATSATPAAPGDINALIAEAAQDFTEYQQLTAAGKLAEAGQKLEALKRILEQLQTHRH